MILTGKKDEKEKEERKEGRDKDINNIITELDLSASEQELVSAEKMHEVFAKIDISPDLKNTVRLLLLSEGNNIITAVLKKLNGDKKMWEEAKRDPPTLLRMIAEEQQQSMYQLQKAIGAREERNKLEKEGRILLTKEEKEEQPTAGEEIERLKQEKEK